MTQTHRTPPDGHAYAWRAYAYPIATGLLITAAGLLPWMLLSDLNARIRPDLPWAALITVVVLAILIGWLQGYGPPGRSAQARRTLLRLWPPQSRQSDGMPVWKLIAMLALMYLLWIAIGRSEPLPDLGGYPTTSHRWSMFIMGAVTAGVVEEVAFRGYMQRGIERRDPANAIWITSVVFVLAHITQGPAALLILGPGLFIASMLFGALARRTGTILPGMVLHVIGDLASVYFGALGGDASLLFVDH